MLEFCLANEAPSCINDSKSGITARPLYYKADITALAVSQLCALETDLSRIPKELFEKHQNSNGKEFYRVNYQLVLTPKSASLLFDLEFNGISYGTVRSRY